MKTPFYLFFTFALASLNGFSSDHPAVIYLTHHGDYKMSYTPGSYIIEGHYAPLTDTFTMEMNAGDSCLAFAQGSGISAPLQYFKLYKNGILVQDLPGVFDAWVTDEGDYLVETFNGGPGLPFPVVKAPFKVRHVALGTKDPFITSTVFTLYPNPCTDVVNLKAGDHDLYGAISITDLNGKQVWNESSLSLAAGTQHTISTAQWQSGVYFLQVFTGTGIQRFRLVKH